MTIFYKGFTGIQSPEYGIEIRNKNNVVLLHYKTPNVVYDAGDIMFCIEEYINHCNINVERYYNYVCILPHEYFPEKDYYKSTSRRDQSKADKMDPYTFVSSRW